MSRRSTALALFVVVAFALVVWRTERQDLHLRQAAWDTCQTRTENVARTNSLYRGLIRIEQDNPFQFTSPATVADRISLFTGALLTPPECGERP